MMLRLATSYQLVLARAWRGTGHMMRAGSGHELEHVLAHLILAVDEQLECRVAVGTQVLVATASPAVSDRTHVSGHGDLFATAVTCDEVASSHRLAPRAPCQRPSSLS